MARNIADLRDEIMIRDPSSARMRGYLCIALRISRIFCEFSVIAPVAGNGESTVVHLPHQKLFSASSSLPFHVIVFALLSNERPYTNPG